MFGHMCCMEMRILLACVGILAGSLRSCLSGMLNSRHLRGCNFFVRVLIQGLLCSCVCCFCIRFVAIVATSSWRLCCLMYLSYSCGCARRVDIRSCVCRGCDLCVPLLLYVARCVILVRSLRFCTFVYVEIAAVVIGLLVVTLPRRFVIHASPPGPSEGDTPNGYQLALCFVVHLSGGGLCNKWFGRQYSGRVVSQTIRTY